MRIRNSKFFLLLNFNIKSKLIIFMYSAILQNTNSHLHSKLCSEIFFPHLKHLVLSSYFTDSSFIRKEILS